jgi:hypothetical protein
MEKPIFDRFWMKKKRLHKMNLASSSSAYMKSSSRQKSAILRKFKLSSKISTGGAHTTLLPSPSQSSAVYEHIGWICFLIIFMTHIDEYCTFLIVYPRPSEFNYPTAIANVNFPHLCLSAECRRK